MRTSAVHDGHVRQDPVIVVCLQAICQKLNVGVTFLGAHNVVRQAHLDLGPRHPSWKRQQGVQIAAASLCLVRSRHATKEAENANVIEVYIEAAMVSQNEVSDGVGALNGIAVVVVCREKPRVFIFKQLSRCDVRPKLNTTQQCSEICTIYCTICL